MKMFLIGSIVLIFALFVLYGFFQKDETPIMDPTEETQQENSVGQATGAVTVMENPTTKRYAPYTKKIFDEAAGKRRVLFFYASWCPTCRQADPDLSSREQEIPQDVTVIRVNYNDPDTDEEEKALAQTYSITYQHTFVQIDAAGKKIHTWNGGKTDELLSNIR